MTVYIITEMGLENEGQVDVVAVILDEGSPDHVASRIKAVLDAKVAEHDPDADEIEWDSPGGNHVREVSLFGGLIRVQVHLAEVQS